MVSHLKKIDYDGKPVKADPSSMLIWHPIVKDLQIPQPKTTLIPLTRLDVLDFEEHKLNGYLLYRIMNASLKLPTPLFIRTDLSSNKTFWSDSCFVSDGTLQSVAKHTLKVAEYDTRRNRRFRAIAVREYIEMNGTFKAFLDLPINSERRYFVRGGTVERHIPLWTEKDILSGQSSQNPLPDDWKQQLAILNTESKDEVSLLTGYAKQVGATLGEYWMLDFCKGRNGKWYLLDCECWEGLS